jgi:hypothetical protein
MLYAAAPQNCGASVEMPSVARISVSTWCFSAPVLAHHASRSWCTRTTRRRPAKYAIGTWLPHATYPQHFWLCSDVRWRRTRDSLFPSTASAFWEFSRLRVLVDRSLRVRNIQVFLLSSLLHHNTAIAPRYLAPPSSVFRQRGRVQCFVFCHNRNSESSKNTHFISFCARELCPLWVSQPLASR